MLYIGKVFHIHINIVEKETKVVKKFSFPFLSCKTYASLDT